MVARDTEERDGALPWHCSLLWVMKAGRELNCFLHFPHRNTSSSSAVRKSRASGLLLHSPPSTHLWISAPRGHPCQETAAARAKLSILLSLRPSDVTEPILPLLPYTNPPVSLGHTNPTVCLLIPNTGTTNLAPVAPSAFSQSSSFQSISIMLAQILFLRLHKAQEVPWIRAQSHCQLVSQHPSTTLLGFGTYA